MSHTVEKIGGTSIADAEAALNNVFLPSRRKGDPYNRIFVVSAYAGMTNELLEDKKTKEPGVYTLYSHSESDWAWGDALTKVCRRMIEKNEDIFTDPGVREPANQFVLERIEGVRSCLIDLQRLCSYGHFHLGEHMMTVREMLSALGEAHSAFNTALMLRMHGVEARFVDLTGWRDDKPRTLEERIDIGLQGIDFEAELPIVTGYTQCHSGLFREYGRGYTEVTFSHVAARTGASEAIIHKEYHLSSADPLIVGEDKVEKIGNTNYDVADQLSNMGMEAVHPRAAKVLRQAEIPLRIRNTFDPDDPGTVIRQDYVSDEPCVEIVTGCRSVLALKLFDQDIVGVSGVDRRIIEVLEEKRLRIVTKDMNANTVTHFVTGTLSRAKHAIAELERLFPQADIDLRRVGLVSVIGSDLDRPGLLADTVGCLHQSGIDVIALHQGMRQVDIQIIVDEADYDAAIKTLHERLVENKESVGDLNAA